MVRAFCPVVFMLFPIIFLLSLSFFILLVLANVKTQTLKIFGYIIVALIWLTTVLVFAGGVYKAAKRDRHFGMHPGMHMGKMIKHPAMGMFEKGDNAGVIVCPKMEKR
ncbi:MAG: hypothetical protein PHP17_04040 [Candidatus Omnitrophica bacterium]|nr:hypothetical protein [Candidatus Omnitrophota bacterium]